MESIHNPEEFGFGYFISIFLPGFIIALAILFWLNKLPLEQAFNLSPQQQGEKTVLIGSRTALYAIYFITTPFIFGLFTDALRHLIINKLVKNLFNAKEGLWDWNFPKKDAFLIKSDGKNEKKLSETVLLRRADKSYVLYYVYEFFGNLLFAIIISGGILLFLKIFGFCVYAIIVFVSGIFCLISMWSYWDDNQILCQEWELINLDENQDKNPEGHIK